MALFRGQPGCAGSRTIPGFSCGLQEVLLTIHTMPIVFSGPLAAMASHRDVQNRFFNLVRFWFAMSLVQFGSKNAFQFVYYSYLLLV